MGGGLAQQENDFACSGRTEAGLTPLEFLLSVADETKDIAQSNGVRRRVAHIPSRKR
jgi:hypothetical protein